MFGPGSLQFPLPFGIPNSPEWTAGYCACIGVAFGGFATFGIVRGHASLNWPAAEGRVRSTWVERDSDNGKIVKVLVEYSVGRELYERTETIPHRGLFATRYRIQSLVDSLPLGTPMPVYYDPGNPRVSRLRRGIRGSDLFGLTLGVGILLFGCHILLATL
jgi:hypothetical protein